MLLPLDTDYLTKDGAQILAQTIRSYWSQRGHDAKVFVNREPFNASERWVVRSTMSGGRP